MPYHYLDTSQGQMHVRREGSGPPIVLLHNIARSVDVFRRLVPVLAEDFDVVAVDMPGFGRSYKPATPFDTTDMALGVGEVVSHLAEETSSGVSIYGHRYGATVAAQIAIDRPEDVSALVMSDFAYIRSEEERREWYVKSSVETSGGPAGLPAVLSEPDGSHLMRLWHRGYQRYLWGTGEFGPMDELADEGMQFVNSYVIDTITAGHYGALAFEAAFRYPSDERLPLIEVPTLVFHGTVGFEVPICQRSSEVAALIPGARQGEVEGDAHMVYFRHQEVAEMVRRFVLDTDH